jgi:hypothetical protein
MKGLAKLGGLCGEKSGQHWGLRSTLPTIRGTEAAQTPHLCWILG